MAARVLVLGGVSFNIMIYLAEFPRPEPHTLWSEHYHETIGETGVGKAVNFSRLGLQTTLYALIGDDPYGTMIHDQLTRERLIFIYDTDPQGTQRHVNLMDQQGQRISIIMAPGSFEPIINPLRVEKALVAADYVVLNIDNYCHQFIPLIEQYNKPIWCDIHDYDGMNPYYAAFIDAATFVFLSSDVLPDYGPFMETLVTRGKQLVVCTHGRHGSTALTAEGRWIETPIIDAYERADTNGAGDSFFAGFVYGHSQGYSVERCLQLGSVVSGLSITGLELAYSGLSAELAEAQWREHYLTAED
jgi:sugar/nucleoside kinase (ribokinase family)